MCFSMVFGWGRVVMVESVSVLLGSLFPGPADGGSRLFLGLIGLFLLWFLHCWPLWPPVWDS